VPYVIANCTEKICIDEFFLSEIVKILIKEILVTKISGRKFSQCFVHCIPSEDLLLSKVLTESFHEEKFIQL
jgi:hypothetical protein